LPFCFCVFRFVHSQRIKQFWCFFHNWGPKIISFSHASLAIPALDFRIWGLSHLFAIFCSNLCTCTWNPCFILENTEASGLNVIHLLIKKVALVLLPGLLACLWALFHSENWRVLLCFSDFVAFSANSENWVLVSIENSISN